MKTGVVILALAATVQFRYYFTLYSSSSPYNKTRAGVATLTRPVVSMRECATLRWVGNRLQFLTTGNLSDPGAWVVQYEIDVTGEWVGAESHVSVHVAQ